MFEISGDDALQIVVTLVKERSEWIRRRTDSFSFDDDSVITQSTTYEFEVPIGLPDVFFGRKLLPVGKLSRTPARRVNLYLDDGESSVVPTVTRAEERYIVASGFARLLFLQQPFKRKRVPESRICSQLLEVLDDLPLSQTTDSVTGGRHMQSRRTKLADLEEKFPGAALAVKYMNERMIVVPISAPTGSDPLKRIVVSHSEPFELVAVTARTSRKAIAARNARRISAKPSRSRRQRIVSHFRRNVEVGLTDGHLTPKWLRAGVHRFDRSLVVADSSGTAPELYRDSAAGLRYQELWPYRHRRADTYAVTLILEDITESESYHIETICPPGVYVEDAKLRAMNRRKVQSNRPAVATEMIVVTDDEHHTDRTHLYFSSALSQLGSKGRPYWRQHFDIVLRPTYEGGLRRGMWASVTATASLFILIFTIGIAGVTITWVLEPKSGNNNAEAIVAVLLLALTISLGAIAQEKDHPLTRHVQKQYRTRLFLTEAALFVAALSEALNVRHWVFLGVLIGSFSISLVCCIITVRSGRYAKAQMNAKRVSAESAR